MPTLKYKKSCEVSLSMRDSLVFAIDLLEEEYGWKDEDLFLTDDGLHFKKDGKLLYTRLPMGNHRGPLTRVREATEVDKASYKVLEDLKERLKKMC